MEITFSQAVQGIMDGMPKEAYQYLADMVAAVPRDVWDEDGASDFVKVRGVVFSFRRCWSKDEGYVLTSEEARIFDRIGDTLGHAPTIGVIGNELRVNTDKTA